jgi:HD-like signal output (HDOD) protein
MADEELRAEDVPPIMGAARAARYLGITTSRLSAIRRAKHEAHESFGEWLADRWVYKREELDAYKATRNPQGGRPPGSKTETAALAPIAVV